MLPVIAALVIGHLLTACSLEDLKLPDIEVSVRDGNALADEKAPLLKPDAPDLNKDSVIKAETPKTMPLEDFHAIVGTLTYFTIRCTKDGEVDEACIDRGLECVIKSKQPRSREAGMAVRRCGSEALK